MWINSLLGVTVRGSDGNSRLSYLCPTGCNEVKNALQVFLNVLLTMRHVFVKYLDYAFVCCLCFQTDSFCRFGIERRIWLICNIAVIKICTQQLIL